MTSTPDAYVVEQIRAALAKDARVNELGIIVTLVGPRVFLTGVVTSADRQSAITAVVGERFPDLEICNDVQVQRVGPAGEGETLT